MIEFVFFLVHIFTSTRMRWALVRRIGIFQHIALAYKIHGKVFMPYACTHIFEWFEDFVCLLFPFKTISITADAMNICSSRDKVEKPISRCFFFFFSFPQSCFGCFQTVENGNGRSGAQRLFYMNDTGKWEKECYGIRGLSSCLQHNIVRDVRQGFLLCSESIMQEPSWPVCAVHGVTVLKPLPFLHLSWARSLLASSCSSIPQPEYTYIFLALSLKLVGSARHFHFHILTKLEWLNSIRSISNEDLALYESEWLQLFECLLCMALSYCCCRCSAACALLEHFHIYII